MDRSSTNPPERKEIDTRQTTQKSRQWRGPVPTYPSIEATIKSDQNNLDTEQVLDILRQYKWQQPMEQATTDFIENKQQNYLFDTLNDNLERYNKVQPHYDEFTGNGIQFIFPKELKEYKELIDNCEECHRNIIEIQTSSPLPETNYNQTLYEKHKEVHSNFSQAITEAETFQKTIEESIAKYKKATQESTKSLREHPDYNSLPTYARDYIEETHWIFQSTTPTLDLEHQNCINLIHKSPNNWKQAVTELGDYINNYIKNPINKKQMSLLKETAKYISTYNINHPLDLSIKEIISFDNILENWHLQLQEITKNLKRSPIIQWELNPPVLYTIRSEHAELHVRIQRHTNFIPNILENILKKQYSAT